MNALEDLFAGARVRLAGSPRDRLGELIVPRRILGLQRPPRIVPREAAWHLGALLVADAAVYATGEILRAREQVRRGFTAESQRERDGLAGAARRGGFAEGEVVHVGWTPIDLAVLARGEASGPVSMADARPMIRWNSFGGRMPLQAYLDEQIELHVRPPAGSN